MSEDYHLRQIWKKILINIKFRKKEKFNYLTKLLYNLNELQSEKKGFQLTT